MLAYLPRKAAGRLMVREVEALSRLLGEPARPFAAILGGAKIEGKIDTLENLLPRLDILMVGGGMANTFLAAHGYDLKASLVEHDRIELAADILARAAARHRVPAPHRPGGHRQLREPAGSGPSPPAAFPRGFLALDVGPARAPPSPPRSPARRPCSGTARWASSRSRPSTPAPAPSPALAACSGFTVIGGGETVAAVHQAGVAERIGHVSTGGGASLEFLAGRELPGVAALLANG